jgi:hypothetical protein
LATLSTNDEVEKSNVRVQRSLRGSKGTVYAFGTPAYSYSIEVGGFAFYISVESNATISSFTFEQIVKTLRFNVTGPAGRTGYCNVTIPRELLSGTFTVFIDGAPINYTPTPSS